MAVILQETSQEGGSATSVSDQEPTLCRQLVPLAAGKQHGGSSK